MRQQGCCTLPVNEADRVVDRLAGLEKVISSESIRQALFATDRVNPRSGKTKGADLLPLEKRCVPFFSLQRRAS